MANSIIDMLMQAGARKAERDMGMNVSQEGGRTVQEFPADNPLVGGVAPEALKGKLEALQAGAGQAARMGGRGNSATESEENDLESRYPNTFGSGQGLMRGPAAAVAGPAESLIRGYREQPSDTPMGQRLLKSVTPEAGVEAGLAAIPFAGPTVKRLMSGGAKPAAGGRMAGTVRGLGKTPAQIEAEATARYEARQAGKPPGLPAAEPTMPPRDGNEIAAELKSAKGEARSPDNENYPKNPFWQAPPESTPPGGSPISVAPTTRGPRAPSIPARQPGQLLSTAPPPAGASAVPTMPALPSPGANQSFQEGIESLKNYEPIGGTAKLDALAEKIRGMQGKPTAPPPAPDLATAEGNLLLNNPDIRRAQPRAPSAPPTSIESTPMPMEDMVPSDVAAMNIPKNRAPVLAPESASNTRGRGAQAMTAVSPGREPIAQALNKAKTNVATTPQFLEDQVLEGGRQARQEAPFPSHEINPEDVSRMEGPAAPEAAPQSLPPSSGRPAIPPPSIEATPMPRQVSEFRVQPDDAANPFGLDNQEFQGARSWTPDEAYAYENEVNAPPTSSIYADSSAPLGEYPRGYTPTSAPTRPPTASYMADNGMEFFPVERQSDVQLSREGVNQRLRDELNAQIENVLKRGDELTRPKLKVLQGGGVENTPMPERPSDVRSFLPPEGEVAQQPLPPNKPLTARQQEFTHPEYGVSEGDVPMSGEKAAARDAEDKASRAKTRAEKEKPAEKKKTSDNDKNPTKRPKK